MSRTRPEAASFTAAERLGLWLLGLLWVCGAGGGVWQADLGRAEAELAARAEAVHVDIAQRVSSARAVLSSVVGLYQGSNFLSATELASVSEQILADNPHLALLGQLQWLTPGGAEAFEASMRHSGYRDFQVRRAPDAAPAPGAHAGPHLVVSLVEPLEPDTVRLMGLDVLADPRLRRRIEQAVETGAAVFAPAAVLGLPGSGFAVLKPTYFGHYVPDRPAERRQQVSGAFLVVLDLARVVEQVQAAHPTVRIVLGLGLGPGGELSRQVVSRVAAAAPPAGWLPDLRAERSFTVQDHPLRVIVTRGQGAGAELRSWMAGLVMALAALAYLALVHIAHQRRVAGRDAQRSEAAIHRERERAEVTLQSIGDGVVTTDGRWRVQYLNPIAELLAGVRAEAVRGRRIHEVLDLFYGDSRAPVFGAEGTVRVEDCRMEGNLVLRREGGQLVAVDLTASPLRERDGSVAGAVLVLRDVSRERELRQELVYQASHDPLTGLPNRRAFEARLKEAILSSRSHGTSHALCYLDLDQFKLVNDTSGHAVGDQLLRRLAPLLATQLRAGDLLARLGGDEFGVLIGDCSMTRAAEVAERLRSTVANFRFQWHEKVFGLGVSIGVVPIHRHSGTITDVLSAADIACYAAKDRGRDCIHAYEPQDETIARRHGEMQWLPRIRTALEEGRFALFVQDMQPLAPGAAPTRICEVLIRMRSPSGELIPPMAFIPAAERYELMPRIDRWVIERLLMTVREQALDRADALFSINLSGQSVDAPDLADYVVERMRAWSVDPARLCFEVTETAAISNFREAREFIGRLRAAGCRFALDDFGAGLSSFAYLKHLPVDLLKIDGQFVKGLKDDPVDRALVETINSIGHVLGMQTVAESVEDAVTLDLLRGIGPDYVQGFHVHRPRLLADASGVASPAALVRDGS